MCMIFQILLWMSATFIHLGGGVEGCTIIQFEPKINSKIELVWFFGSIGLDTVWMFKKSIEIVRLLF